MLDAWCPARMWFTNLGSSLGFFQPEKKLSFRPEQADVCAFQSRPCGIVGLRSGGISLRMTTLPMPSNMANQTTSPTPHTLLRHIPTQFSSPSPPPASESDSDSPPSTQSPALSSAA